MHTLKEPQARTPTQASASDPVDTGALQLRAGSKAGPCGDGAGLVRPVSGYHGDEVAMGTLWLDVISGGGPTHRSCAFQSEHPARGTGVAWRDRAGPRQQEDQQVAGSSSGLPGVQLLLLRPGQQVEATGPGVQVWMEVGGGSGLGPTPGIFFFISGLFLLPVFRFRATCHWQEKVLVDNVAWFWGQLTFTKNLPQPTERTYVAPCGLD
ncbi:hypothetical protein CB1_000880040 [Camelus ferus]|nr:hypothetical protein CB1_000880040 [Camelus ferus]